jgi:hypothetical protein
LNKITAAAVVALLAAAWKRHDDQQERLINLAYDQRERLTMIEAILADAHSVQLEEAGWQKVGT